MLHVHQPSTAGLDPWRHIVGIVDRTTSPSKSPSLAAVLDLEHILDHEGSSPSRPSSQSPAHTLAAANTAVGDVSKASKESSHLSGSPQPSGEQSYGNVESAGRSLSDSTLANSQPTSDGRESVRLPTARPTFAPGGRGASPSASPSSSKRKRSSVDLAQAERPPAKKQSKWSEQEDRLIIALRGEGKKWDEVAQHLPGRTAISCRLHYQNFLERRAYWDEEKKNRLARLYER